MVLLERIIATDAPAAIFLIRVTVGSVLFSEGIQKLLYPTEIGAGRFAKIGLPSPEILGPFVGTVEIVCGSMVLLGSLTRLAAFRL